MPEAEESAPSAAGEMFGDFAPALVRFTDDTLFGQVWTRPELSLRDRSLITVACLVSGGNTVQLVNHLARAKRNGLTEAELIEAITHLAFYARLAAGHVGDGGSQGGLRPGRGRAPGRQATTTRTTEGYHRSRRSRGTAGSTAIRGSPRG